MSDDLPMTLDELIRSSPEAALIAWADDRGLARVEVVESQERPNVVAVRCLVSGRPWLALIEHWDEGWRVNAEANAGICWRRTAGNDAVLMIVSAVRVGITELQIAVADATATIRVSDGVAAGFVWGLPPHAHFEQVQVIGYVENRGLHPVRPDGPDEGWDSVTA
jgi:hypothetical protein